MWYGVVYHIGVCLTITVTNSVTANGGITIEITIAGYVIPIEIVRATECGDEKTIKMTVSSQWLFCLCFVEQYMRYRWSSNVPLFLT